MTHSRRARVRSMAWLLLLTLVMTTVLAACGGAAPAPAADAPAAEAPAADAAAAPATEVDLSQKEAPMLAEKVAADELPPLEERLPATPLVVEPVEAPGKYGGTWKIGVTNPRATYFNTRSVSESLAMWDRTASTPVPDVAERWEVSADGTTYTFYLRAGMKWSDGTPFTSADILFWWNDIILNTDYTPAPPDWVRIKGEIPTVTAPDETTVIFQFPHPYGLFLQNLAFRGVEMMNFPKHYISQFHPAYVEEAELTAKIAELGYETWQTAILDLIFPTNPDLPRLSAWVNTTKNPETSAIYVRNPYYW